VVISFSLMANIGAVRKPRHHQKIFHFKTVFLK